MHDKKNYSNKSSHAIQGLKTISKSLPRGLKTILKKGGYNYSSIINNWSKLVGKKISDVCYPKSIKTPKELKNGTLILNVSHGNELFIEYSKRDIIEKINAFFGYQFIKEIRLILIKDKMDANKKITSVTDGNIRYHKKIEDINNASFKKNLSKLINAFDKKK